MATTCEKHRDESPYDMAQTCATCNRVAAECEYSDAFKACYGVRPDLSTTAASTVAELDADTSRLYREAMEDERGGRC